METSDSMLEEMIEETKQKEYLENIAGDLIDIEPVRNYKENNKLQRFTRFAILNRELCIIHNLKDVKLTYIQDTSYNQSRSFYSKSLNSIMIYRKLSLTNYLRAFGEMIGKKQPKKWSKKIFAAVFPEQSNVVVREPKGVVVLSKPKGVQ